MMTEYQKTEALLGRRMLAMAKREGHGKRFPRKEPNNGCSRRDFEGRRNVARDLRILASLPATCGDVGQREGITGSDVSKIFARLAKMNYCKSNRKRPATYTLLEAGRDWLACSDVQD